MIKLLPAGEILEVQPEKTVDYLPEYGYDFCRKITEAAGGPAINSGRNTTKSLG